MTDVDNYWSVFRLVTPDQRKGNGALYAALAGAVARFKAELDDDDQEQFRSDLDVYVRGENATGLRSSYLGSRRGQVGGPDRLWRSSRTSVSTPGRAPRSSTSTVSAGAESETGGHVELGGLDGIGWTSSSLRQEQLHEEGPGG